MTRTTKIEWTTKTFNPITGCHEVSPGCANCYAKRFAERFRGVAGHPFEHGFDFQLRQERLRQPLMWKKPALIFVCSMSDLFHHNTPDSYISEVFEMMAEADHHTFQVLTKRAHRMEQWIAKHLERVPDNVWIGVTVEDQERVSRIEHLARIPAKTKFVSFEPLLEEVIVPDDLMQKVNWAIVGGESGPRARRMEAPWAITLRDQCQRLGVAYFFKQWGEFDENGQRVGKKRAGKLLEGQEWLEYPTK